MQASKAYLPGYLNCYVTPDGRVFNNGKEKKPIQKGNCSPQVRLQENKRTRHYGLATLVATHFVPNPNGYTKIIFKDGNNRNCAASNLSWVSGREYIRHNLFPGKPLNEPQSSGAASKESAAQKREGCQEAGERRKKEQQAALLPPDPTCLPIPGFPYYYAAPSGEIWSKNRKLTPFRHGSGGGRVKVKPEGGPLTRYSVARLVALTFLPNPNGYQHFIFKDRDKTNYAKDNLQWVSEFSYRSWYLNSGSELLGAPRSRKKPLPLPVERHPGSKPIRGYEGYYISPEGVVYKENRLVHINRPKGKAAKVKLRKGNSVPAVYHYFGLATLVAQHFIPNPNKHNYIIFKDRNNHNCHKDNLAWVDGETFMWYCGITWKTSGRKKIVVERDVAIQTAKHPLLRQYYKTGDRYWLEECWKEIERKLQRNYDWKHLKSDCWLYFADRADRYSILGDPTGLLLYHIKGIRKRLRKEISEPIPFTQLIKLDESLRYVTGEY